MAEMEVKFIKNPSLIIENLKFYIIYIPCHILINSIKDWST